MKGNGVVAKLLSLISYYFLYVCMNFPYYCNTIDFIIIIIIIIIFITWVSLEVPHMIHINRYIIRKHLLDFDLSMHDNPDLDKLTTSSVDPAIQIVKKKRNFKYFALWK